MAFLSLSARISSRCTKSAKVHRMPLNTTKRFTASRKLTSSISDGKGGYSFKHFLCGLGVGTSILAVGVALHDNNNRVVCKDNSLKVDVGTSTHQDNNKDISLEDAISAAKELIIRKKDELGIPGISICVSVDGQEMWSTGFGYSDMENRVNCKSETIMRIASISKPLTMVAIAKLWEDNKLDLDVPVQQYVPDFPEKTVEGEKVTITTRHLLSHLSGIRSYDKKYMKKKSKDKHKDKDEDNQNDVPQKSSDGVSETQEKNLPGSESDIKATIEDEKDLTKCHEGKDDKKKNKKKKKDKHTDNDDEIPAEFYLKKRFESVTDSLNLFKDDPLMHKPGSKHHYTTYGFTLVSAVVEGASKEKFIPHMKKIFKDLGLKNTVPDEPEPIVYNRASYYTRKKGKLVNVPYVDLSYKWAGGGFLSDVHDLVKFGNAMLYSYQWNSSPQENCTAQLLPGYLKSTTMKEIWTAVVSAKTGDEYAGMGWFISPEINKYGCCRYQEYYVNHTGGAVGASSILLVLPSALPLGEKQSDTNNLLLTAVPPKGVVVAILVNLQSISLRTLALEIAKTFEQVKRS